MTVSAERAAGDRYLKEHGPTMRRVLILAMADHVQPGKAYRHREMKRSGEARRQGREAPVREVTVEAYAAGARAVVARTLWIAVKKGTWLREGDLIWHKDGPYPEGREP
jgi:hypothetical protein